MHVDKDAIAHLCILEHLCQRQGQAGSNKSIDRIFSYCMGSLRFRIFSEPSSKTAHIFPAICHRNGGRAHDDKAEPRQPFISGMAFSHLWLHRTLLKVATGPIPPSTSPRTRSPQLQDGPALCRTRERIPPSGSQRDCKCLLIAQSNTRTNT